MILEPERAVALHSAGSPDKVTSLAKVSRSLSSRHREIYRGREDHLIGSLSLQTDPGPPRISLFARRLAWAKGLL
jgi:hypothetical protein